MGLYLGDAPKLEELPGLSNHDPARLDMWPTEETKQQRADALRWSLYWARGVDINERSGVVMSPLDETDLRRKQECAEETVARARLLKRRIATIQAATNGVIYFLMFLVVAALVTGEGKRDKLTRKTYVVGAILAGLTLAYLDHRRKEGETVNGRNERRTG